MPVIPNNPWFKSCDEIWVGRGGQVYSMDGNRSHVRKFLVVVNQKEMSEVSVCLCPGIPRGGELYNIVAPPGVGSIEYDVLAMATSIRADQQHEGDWQNWIVTVEYSTRIPNGVRVEGPAGAAAAANNPEQELPEISWSHESAQEARPFDLDGRCYLNTANMPFNPPVMFDVDYPVLTISRNEFSFNYAKANFYNRSLNSATFLGAPPGCVQVFTGPSEYRNRGNFWYNRTTYKLKFRPLQKNGGYILPRLNVILPTYDEFGNFDGETAFPNLDTLIDTWQPLILNQGMFRIGGSEPGDFPAVLGLPVPIFKFGQQVSHNVLLNELGGEAKAANPAVDPTIEPWYIQFRNFRYVNLAGLLVKGLA